MFGDLTLSWGGGSRGEVSENEWSGNLGRQRKLLAKKVRDECRRGWERAQERIKAGDGTCEQGHW